MKSVPLSDVPEVERETEAESEEDLEVETGDVQRAEAEAGDPVPPVLATKARKLRIGTVTIGYMCHAGWELTVSLFLPLKKKYFKILN